MSAGRFAFTTTNASSSKLTSRGCHAARPKGRGTFFSRVPCIVLRVFVRAAGVSRPAAAPRLIRSVRLLRRVPEPIAMRSAYNPRRKYQALFLDAKRCQAFTATSARKMRRTNGMLIPRRYTLARQNYGRVQTPPPRDVACSGRFPSFFRVPRLAAATVSGGTIEKVRCRFANKVRHR